MGNVTCFSLLEGECLRWKQDTRTWSTTHSSTTTERGWPLRPQTQPSRSLTSSVFKAHAVGVNSVSWAPALPEGSLTNTGRTARSDGSDLVHRFVSGGCDNMVKIWSLSNGEWTVEHALEHHTEWIRSVAWAPNVGLPTATIASAGQDGDIVVWSKDGSDSAWNKKVIATLPETPWSVSFSLTGNILAVAGTDGNVSLWKE